MISQASQQPINLEDIKAFRDLKNEVSNVNVLLKNNIGYLERSANSNRELQKSNKEFSIALTNLTSVLYNNDKTGQEGIIAVVGRHGVKLDNLYVKIGVAMGASNALGIILGSYFL